MIIALFQYSPWALGSGKRCGDVVSFYDREVASSAPDRQGLNF